MKGRAKTAPPGKAGASGTRLGAMLDRRRSDLRIRFLPHLITQGLQDGLAQVSG